MKKVLLILCLPLFFSFHIFCQEDETIRIKAGTKVLDYFPVNKRYLYKGFQEGKLTYNNGMSSPGKFNYNILIGDIQFIKSSDTLSIANKKDIRFLTVAQDTFFYENDYIRLIHGGKVKVGINQKIIMKDIERKGAYGVTDRNSAIDTYNSLYSTGMFYQLVPDEDLVLKNEKTYYISSPSGGFVILSRKNILDVLPEEKERIKEYLKTSKFDFTSTDDIAKLADFLNSLFPETP